jgi:CRP-like cAMP-binding protein
VGADESALSQLVDALRVRALDADEVVFERARPCSSLYLVAVGTVLVSASAADGKLVETRVTAGTPFGTACLYAHLKHTSALAHLAIEHAVATEPTVRQIGRSNRVPV